MAAEFSLVVVSEPEAACERRLLQAGFPPDVAAEIRPYLSQATDLADFADEISAAVAEVGGATRFVALDELLPLLSSGDQDLGRTVLWSMTDGIAYYRGSAVAPLARLAGAVNFGSPPQAQHLCQDKFKTAALAATAGLRTPPTLLCRGGEVVAQLGDPGAGPYFVKPNRLGSKIGIFSDSRCEDLDTALARAARLAGRYRDDAVVQSYIPGFDIRVSYMDLGRPLAPSLGITRLVKDPRSETGGDFMTMRDNATLSGSRDIEGGVTGFGAGQALAFTPKVTDLRAEAAAGDARLAAAIVEIEAMVLRAVRLFGLQDYFSFDFRLADDGSVYFLEFEVCPGVTIYDFQTYLKLAYGLGLGPALARSVRRAFDAGVGKTRI